MLISNFGELSKISVYNTERIIGGHLGCENCFHSFLEPESASRLGLDSPKVLASDPGLPLPVLEPLLVYTSGAARQSRPHDSCISSAKIRFCNWKIRSHLGNR